MIGILRYLLLILFSVGFLICVCEAQTQRILIVGDSWAMSITSENKDGFPAPDIFDDVLESEGFQCETRGAHTAWSGRKASDWAKPEHLAVVVSELEKFPTIDIVHLIVGGNDFLSHARDANFRTKNPEERLAIWNKVGKSIEAIVTACLDVRQDIRVVIADYDYLDPRRAEQFWKQSFHGASISEFNEWLLELGEVKRRIADRTERCEYLDNWGVLQYWFGNPPKSVPFPGGDKNLPMPESASVDGIHPNEAAHKKLLQNAMDRYYTRWLSDDTVSHDN